MLSTLTSYISNVKITILRVQLGTTRSQARDTRTRDKTTLENNATQLLPLYRWELHV